MGAPWKSGGRDSSGIDCLGVVLWWFARLGFAVDDPISGDADHVRNSEFAKQFTKVDSPRFGDVSEIVMQGGENHIGVCLFDGLLHATKNHGVVVSKYRIVEPVAFYRLKVLNV